MIQKWKLRDSKYIHRDKWLKVRSGTYEISEDGREISPYYTFEYPDWVNIFALTKEGYVVVNRQYRAGLGRIGLELPSGWVEPSEKPEETACRELLEETGYQAREVVLTGSVSANPATHDNLNYCFLTQNVNLVQSQKLDFGEEIEVGLIHISEIRHLALSGAFIQALHVSAIFFALERLKGK